MWGTNVYTNKRSIRKLLYYIELVRDDLALYSFGYNCKLFEVKKFVAYSNEPDVTNDL